MSLLLAISEKLPLAFFALPLVLRSRDGVGYGRARCINDTAVLAHVCPKGTAVCWNLKSRSIKHRTGRDARQSDPEVRMQPSILTAGLASV